MLEVLPAYADASELALYDPSTPELAVFPADRLGERYGAPLKQEEAEA